MERGTTSAWSTPLANSNHQGEHSTTRKLIALAAAAATLAVPASALANAGVKTAQVPGGTTAGVTETGWIGTTSGGNGTTTQQYSASYTDPVFGGPLTCNGVHQVKKNGATQDSFTCTLQRGGSWGTTPTVGGPSILWNSDWSGVTGHQNLQGQMTVTSVTANSYTGVATY